MGNVTEITSRWFWVWFEDKYKFNKDFVKNYNEDSDIGSFLKVGVQYPRKLHKSYNDLPFLPERMEVKKLESLYAVWMTRKSTLNT